MRLCIFSFTIKEHRLLPIFYFVSAVQNNTPEYTCFYMSTSAAPNLYPNSYLKLSATLSDVDGWTVFGTGCSGCWSLRRRIGSLKREDTEACELPAAILRSWAIRSPLTYNAQALGTLCPFAYRIASSRFACLRYVCLRDACLLDACLRYAYLSFASLRYASLRDACSRYASSRFASFYDACLHDALGFCLLLFALLHYGYLQSRLVTMLLRIDAFPDFDDFISTTEYWILS